MSSHPISSTFRPTVKSGRSLYIHVPFCRHRCGYCNFTLVAQRDDLIDRYLDAIEREINWLQGDHVVSTVFLGGGTPSHLNHNQLIRLKEIICARFAFSDDCEFSAECNPNDYHERCANTFALMGINRISFGAQSFDPQKLYNLERSHTADDIRAAVQSARSFSSSVSLDLIFATPGESLEAWVTDLQRSVSLRPDHISIYELTYEKGTSFWSRHDKGQLQQADEDLRAEMYLAAIEYLQQAGLEHYEISSFAMRGHRCRHNQSYWNGTQYFAFGPGASRFIDGVRETNHRSTTNYLKRVESAQSPIAERQELDATAIALDRLVFGLRQIDGISLRQYSSSTGLEVIQLLGRLASQFVDAGIMTIDDDSCKLTFRGLLVADWIAEQIFAENQAIKP